ncbi:MAG: FtsX-like permease family protein [Chloroflexi bacterium]|nr:FtsX-like permease family protein [Chloroflexota bacterium]
MIFQWTGWRHLRHHWIRTVLSILGIVMGVTAFTFVPSISRTMRSSASITLDDIAGRADIEIRADQNGIDPALVESVRDVEGVELAVPLSNGIGRLAEDHDLLVFFGIDPAIDRQVRTYKLTEGDFIAGAGEVLLPRTLADDKDISVGDRLTLGGFTGSHEAVVSGILDDSAGVARLNGGYLIVMGLSDAYQLRGAESLDSIAIVTGGDTARVKDSLATVMPDEVEIGDPSGRNRAAEQLLDALDIQMSMINLLVLALGAMLIYNTMSVSVTQRRKEIGVLRSMGVSRRQIQRMFVMEAGALGAIGSALGIVLGIIVVYASRNLPVLPPSNTANLPQSTAQLDVAYGVLPIAFMAGTLTSVVAGYLPARYASRLEPVESMRLSQAERDFVSHSRQRIVIGLVIVLVSLVGVFSLPRTLEYFAINTNLIYLMLGAAIALFGPALIGLGRILPPVMNRLFGAPGLIAADNLTKRPRRVVVTGAMLMVGLWMALLATGSNFGYTAFMEEWQANENIWDLTVMGAGTSYFTPIVSIPPEVIEDANTRPEVAAAVMERYTTHTEGETTYYIRAIDFNAYLAKGARLIWNEGEEDYTALQNADKPSVVVTGMSVVIDGITTGATITVNTPSGEVDFVVVGTVYGALAPDQLTLVMDLGTYRQVWHDNRVDRLMIALEPEASTAEVRRDMQRDYAVYSVAIVDNADMQAAFIERFNSITSVSRLMTALLVVILIGGLTSTMFILVYDRRRDLGMLRALGMVRRQIVSSVILEALLLVGVAVLFAVPGGIFTVTYNSSFVHDMIGIKYAGVQANHVLMTLVVVLVVALVASFTPARTAGRMDVLQALRYE